MPCLLGTTQVGVGSRSVLNGYNASAEFIVDALVSVSSERASGSALRLRFVGGSFLRAHTCVLYCAQYGYNAPLPDNSSPANTVTRFYFVVPVAEELANPQLSLVYGTLPAACGS